MRCCARAELEKKDYAIKPVGATARRFEAIQQDKELAATMLYPPFSISAVSAGYKDLGEAIKVIGPYQAFSGFVLRSWASANADTLVRYLAAIIEGQRFVLNPRNKAAVVKLIVDHLKASEDIANPQLPDRAEQPRQGCGVRHGRLPQRARAARPLYR